jgi:2-dehydro-3-deoxygluconokinase
MGASTRLCSRVGDDAVGRELLAFWAAEGLDVRYVRMDSGAATGMYINENTTAGHRFRYYRQTSAGSRLSVTDFDSGFVAGLRALHVTGISLSISASAAAAAEAAARQARNAGAIISYSVNYRPLLDPDKERLLRLARTADVLFMSVEEARALIAIDAAESIHAALSRTGETIVTDGSRGATVVTARQRLQLPAIAVDVVDAAGAGDALAGTYLALRLRGESAEDSLVAGIAAASLSCRRFGAASSYPRRADVDQAREQAVVGNGPATGTSTPRHRPVSSRP